MSGSVDSSHSGLLDIHCARSLIDHSKAHMASRRRFSRYARKRLSGSVAGRPPIRRPRRLFVPRPPTSPLASVSRGLLRVSLPLVRRVVPSPVRSAVRLVRNVNAFVRPVREAHFGRLVSPQRAAHLLKGAQSVCRRRQVRRQVMHALGVAGRRWGSGSGPQKNRDRKDMYVRRTSDSAFKCR